MKTGYKIALALLAGCGVGVAAMHQIHAQAKPPAYVVVAVRSIKDTAAFKAGVVDRATAAAVSGLGARYVVRTEKVTSLDGPHPQRFIVLAFDSIEKAKAWSEAPIIKEITAARIKSTDSLSFIVEGVTN